MGVKASCPSAGERTGAAKDGGGGGVPATCQFPLLASWKVQGRRARTEGGSHATGNLIPPTGNRHRCPRRTNPRVTGHTGAGKSPTS